MSTLAAIRSLKADYARACCTLLLLEKRGKEELAGEVEVLHSPLARRIEKQRRIVDALELKLLNLGERRRPQPMYRPTETIHAPRYR